MADGIKHKILAIFCFLIIGGLAFGSHIPQQNININPTPPVAIMVFEDVIKPWIKNEFTKNINDEFVKIDRVLIFIKLYRYEVIDGEDRYSVHIEWAQKLTDRKTMDLYSGIKGQEVLFIINNNQITDFFPFEEYWIEFRKLHTMEVRN